MCPRTILLSFLLLGFSLLTFGRVEENTKASSTVADCTTPPTLFLSKLKRPNTATTTAVCQDSLVQLNVRNFVKGSIFQWQKGATNLPNANDSILVIRGSQSGIYRCLLQSPLCPTPIFSTSLTITTNTKPLVSISADNPIDISCKEGKVKLSSNSSGNSTLKYQWFFENQPIPSATSNIFDAIETGIYFLKVVDEFDCANASGALTVITYTPPKADLSASRAGFCKGESVTLKATQGRTYLYKWLRDGQPINESRDSISVNQPGTYTVKLTAPNACTTESNQVSVIQYDDPVVLITSLGNQICPGGSLLLSAQGKDLKRFEWKKEQRTIQNGSKKELTINEAGTYTVTVRDTNRCVATSTPFKVELVNKIAVTFEKIPDFCGANASSVVLKGTPSGGSFSGEGVFEEKFNPQKAGYGEHIVSYQVKGNAECMNGEATQTVRISPPPSLELGPDQSVSRGATISINANLGNGYTYEWTPPYGISDVASSNPTFSPEQSTTYRVKATGASQCVAEDSIRIVVFTPLYIPDAFSPNIDGVNDNWKISGIEEFPEAEVSVFNRWGELVFYKKGLYQSSFDGTFNDQPLPTGIYTYLISTEPKGFTYRGYLYLGR